MPILQQIKHYLGNPKLKRIGVPVQLNENEVEEYVKCADDPIHFIQNYVKIITLDHGFVGIKLYPFQQEAITKINNDRRIIVKAGRQVGKTTMVVGYILWYILFNEDKTVAILANKAPTAREILSRIKIAYEALPLWLQQGVRTWNKGDIELENNSRIMATSTASSAIRGFSISLLYLDEFAFVPTNIAEEFFTSVYPTISSGTSSKILISSTPNGMNHFYKMWTDAVEGRNAFSFIEANWRQVPGRTESWALEQRKVLGEEKYLQEMECEFQGSAGTLISGTVLKSLTFRTPTIASSVAGLDVHSQVEAGHKYIISVDTSRGKGLDHSAFVVFDVTDIPYKVVCKYRNNEISPVVYPSIISNIGKYYNMAYVLVEINDNGQQVADTLFDDYEYENILYTADIKKRLILTLSYAGKAVRGIRTTKSVKRLGCSLLKSMIESRKLLAEDYDIITELSTFINKGTSYEAEEGAHDDLVMCLVLFSWMTNQEFFAELCDMDIKKKLYQEQMEQINEEMLLMPLSGDEFGDKITFVSDGAVWDVVK